MDNIRPGPSTIQHAGRGAFATRAIPAGGLVAPLPLIHVPDREFLDLHPVVPSPEDGEYVRESDHIIGHQLLTNYIFGHPDSTMVFLPTGAGASFINHNAEAPNAKLVWSNHPANERHLFDVKPEDLLEEENMHIALLLHVVAIRDIQPDEEIFLDYGPEWQAAWNKHVQDWNQSVASREWQLRAVDVMDQYRTNVFKTDFELLQEPYPETVELKCFLTFPDTTRRGTYDDPMVWGPPALGVSPYNHDHIRDCVVLDRHKGEEAEAVDMPYYYRVRWTNESGRNIYVKGVPHEAFVFVDAPGTSDQFVTGAFRHCIGIPDDIFPTGPWRNLVSREQ